MSNAAQGVDCDARTLAADLWTLHGHKIVKEIHPKYLDPDKTGDRRVWREERVGGNEREVISKK
jgi:hypothetical protein